MVCIMTPEFNGIRVPWHISSIAPWPYGIGDQVWVLVEVQMAASDSLNEI